MTQELLAAARVITSAISTEAAPAELAAHLAAATDLDWQTLIGHADAHTLTPLLYSVWREAGALDAVPETHRSRMERAWRDNAKRNLNIRDELLEVHRILASAKIPHLVLKGWPLVERLYADPSHRYLSDLDFLVPVDAATAGHQALQAAGYRPLPAKDEWIEKHLPSLWRNDGYPWDGYLYDPMYPRPVELHLRLWERRWRGLAVGDPPRLWDRAQERQVAGVPMHVLSDEDTLIHLAVHFAVHLVERGARLNQLLDLARFAQQTSPSLDWSLILERARAAGVSRFVFGSLLLAQVIFGSLLPPQDSWRQFETDTPPAFLDWLAGEAVEDTLTADYRRREKGKDYRLTFLAANSFQERLRIIRFAAFPPLAQLAAMYQLRHRWLAWLYYPPYVARRVREYRPRPPRRRTCQQKNC